MSRTKRICPRRHIQVREGQIWHKCKCAWCMNRDRERNEERFQEKEIVNEIIEYQNGFDT